MKLDARSASDLRAHVPRLLSRARALLKLSGGPEDRLGPGELKRAAGMVSELHEGLVGERLLARAATYDRPVHLGAYLLWWWPQSYARVRAALTLSALPFSLAGRTTPVRILDLGAGPGPAAIALADHLVARGVRVEALLVDESEAALGEARALALHRPNFTLTTRRADLSATPLDASLGAYDLISAAHLLSELPLTLDERAAFLRKLCDAHLAQAGALLVVEPALRETGRALLEVRDRLLAPPAGVSPLRALAPCLTQQACPALVNPRDWCTAEVSWDAPPHLLQLSRELGLHAEAPLSFAPLLLSREVPTPAADLFRVVGVPPHEKGKKRLFVCAERGRLAVARLDRDATEANAIFEEASRGDCVRLRGLSEKGDGLRLGAGGTIERIVPGA